MEVTYLTWTEDNLLRQVSYQGQREDKPAKQVVRPVPNRLGALAKRDSNGSAARLRARAALLLLTRQSPSRGRRVNSGELSREANTQRQPLGNSCPGSRDRFVTFTNLRQASVKAP